MGEMGDKNFAIEEDGTIVRDTSSSKVNQMKKKISSGGNGDNTKHREGGNGSSMWIMFLIIVGIIIVGIAALSGGDDDLSSEIDSKPPVEHTVNDIQNNALELEVTPDPLGLCPDKNHPHKINMGNGLKWSCCNVGAFTPIDYGNYYAWGETKTKDLYDWSTYKWCNGNESSMTKYCYQSSDGNIDNRTRIEYSDDAARSNWGAGWRMPTIDETDWLVENCTWLWVNIGNVNGYKVKAPNGNIIFLPAAGYYPTGKDHPLWIGSDGYYWTSSLSTLKACGASTFQFTKDQHITFDVYRSHGNSVRPVID